MMNIFERTNGVGELGNPLNESFGDEKYSFDANQSDFLEETLFSEGIQSVEDFDKADVNELLSAIDEKVKSLKPELPTKVNMSRFGKESDVWDAFRHRLEPQYLEAPSDKIQQEQIAE